MQSVLSENKKTNRSHLWIIMKVQKEIFQLRAVIFFVVCFHWLTPRGKNGGYIDVNITKKTAIYHWLNKENNYRVVRASCTLVHFCVVFFQTVGT